MKISLCMIVKNEKIDIKECLDRALPIVDEAIIVDTGSNDGTREILENFKIDKKVQIIDYEWEDDFSKARNKPLEYATGDWILVLDADERIFCDKEKLLKTISDGDELAYSIPIYNIHGGNVLSVFTSMIRLFKNNNPKYSGRIHEQLTIDGIDYMDTKLDKDICKIYHFGYDSEIIEKKNKIERNMDLVMKEIDKNPQEPFNWYNKGVMEMLKNNFDTAMQDFIKANELCKGQLTTFHDDLLKRMIQCMIFKKDYNSAIRFIETLIKGEKIYDTAEYNYYLATCYKNIKKHKKAIEILKKSIDIGEGFGESSKYGTGSFLALLEWAEVLRENYKIDKAIEKYKEGIFHENNVNKMGLNEFKAFLTEQNRQLELEELEKKLFQKEVSTIKDSQMTEYKEKFKKNIEGLIEDGLFDEAKYAIAELRNIIGEDVSLYSMNGIIHMIEGNLDEAEKSFKEGLKKYPNNFDLLYNVGYLYQTKNRNSIAIDFYEQAIKNANSAEDIEEVKGIIESLKPE